MWTGTIERGSYRSSHHKSRGLERADFGGCTGTIARGRTAIERTVGRLRQGGEEEENKEGGEDRGEIIQPLTVARQQNKNAYHTFGLWQDTPWASGKAI